ncbi:MAG: hypothetical protein IPO22_04180 [Anaerolineales bacterium]|nr:hypothetical protein [Anaerolineales bacterium]
MKSIPFSPFAFDPFSSRNLQEWREYVLEWLLRGVLILWFIALISGINNAFKTYAANPNSLLLIISLLAIYLTATALLAFVTLNSKLPFRFRAGGLLLALYIVGTVGLVFSSLSGDGRIILFAFVILSAVFFDLRYSLPVYIFSLFTLLVIGWLQLNGYVVVPSARQINSTDMGAWVSGTLVFLTLSVAVLISITYLLRVLGINLERTHEL